MNKKMISVLGLVGILAFSACDKGTESSDPKVDWTTNTFSMERVKGIWAMDNAIFEKYRSEDLLLYNTGSATMYLQFGVNDADGKLVEDSLLAWEIDPAKPDTLAKYRGNYEISDAATPEISLKFSWCEDWNEEYQVTTKWKECPSEIPSSGTVDSLELHFDKSPIFGSSFEMEYYTRKTPVGKITFE